MIVAADQPANRVDEYLLAGGVSQERLAEIKAVAASLVQVNDTEDGVVLTLSPAGIDLINHPPHYTSHPSGVECIAITEHMNFCLGNAVKYIWRASLKDDQLADLQKARWYVDREITRLQPADREA